MPHIQPRSLILALSLVAALPLAASAGGTSSFLPDYMNAANPTLESATWGDGLSEEIVGEAVALALDLLCALPSSGQTSL